MPKYMLIYHGPAQDMAAMSDDARQAEMGRWMEWMEKVGPNLVDAGAPFGENTSVKADGSRSEPAPVTGYTVVLADDLEGAVSLTDGHPYLASGDDTAVDVHEMIDMGPPQ